MWCHCPFEPPLNRGIDSPDPSDKPVREAWVEPYHMWLGKRSNNREFPPSSSCSLLQLHPADVSIASALLHSCILSIATHLHNDGLKTNFWRLPAEGFLRLSTAGKELPGIPQWTDRPLALGDCIADLHRPLKSLYWAVQAALVNPCRC